MEKLMKNVIYSSIQNFFQNENDFFKYTSQTGMTEWNLTHHLCNELSKYIFWLNNELDVTKLNYNRKRPDIIFHKRLSNRFNLLVVEAKKDHNAKYSDIEKIENHWMSGTLSYRFGAYINIWDIHEFEAILIVKEFNGFKEIKISEDNSEHISLHILEEQFKQHIRNVLHEVDKDSKHEFLEKPLEEKLDHEILKVFSLENRNIR
ncbi:hypothetical protein [Paenibacillus peoriae]|nr:hypothetical protein [Paenibacillus peoriae]ODA06431.1 hypothetical protein A7312_16230 [Paenibacillus polymyxa]OME71725.1 hypothetical protein BK119_08915 [Paenibacillus peoriae]